MATRSTIFIGTIGILMGWGFLSATAHAQDLFAPETRPPLANTEQTDFTDNSTTREMDDMDQAVVRTLDKITGRIGTSTLEVGETVKLGTLFLSVKACRKAPPIEQPESAAFIQIWQSATAEKAKNTNSETEWVFSGWMFASSPALSAMDHPIYDVWVIDCKNAKTPEKEKSAEDSDTSS